MNSSSGIKRGLAATAVAALAVTGIPALASSSSAAVGDSFTVAATGPARNGDAQGAVVTIRFKDGTITPGQLAATGTGSAVLGSEDTDTQTIGTIAAGAPYNDPADSTYDFLDVRVPVTTPTVGATATFRLLENDTVNTTLDASEARETVSIKTGGAVAALSITPASNTTATGVDTPIPYVLSTFDSAGNPTQLTGTEVVNLTSSTPLPGNPLVTFGDAANPAVPKPSDSQISATDAARGSAGFTARQVTVGSYVINANGSAGALGQATAALNVVRLAGNFDAADIDIATPADSYGGFGGANLANPAAPYNLNDGSANVQVRVDQSSIKIDIASNDPADAGATVAVPVFSTTVAFGGKQRSAYTTVLDANGKGSITITPDAGTIQDTDTIQVGGAHNLNFTLVFARSQVSTVASEAEVYQSKLKGSVDIPVTVTDQFGNPVAGATVSAQRGAPNADPTPPTTARKTTDANGKATFTFTDSNAAAGQSSLVTFTAYQDAFDLTANATDTAKINYSVEGQGTDYVIFLDDLNTGTTYTPSSVKVRPLTDTDAGAPGAAAPTGDEVVNVTFTGGDAGAPATISVDNGALLLKNTETRLSQGAASESGVVGSGNTYRIIGTKTGLVTVTVASGGRTHTAQFTVTASPDYAARNVTVSGPAEAESGSLAVFTAVVTDAFGNPVAGVPTAGAFSALNVQVSGPGALQDSGAATDATGSVALNVRLTDDAEGPVTINVTGLSSGGYYQFGAAAGQVDNESPANGAGLPVSSNVATATTTAVAPPVPPVVPADINLKAGGKNNGKKADKLKVTANNKAKGKVAKVFRGGKQIAKHKLNSSGDYTFTIKDKNGKKVTKYTVKVAASNTTLADKASKKLK